MLEKHQEIINELYINLFGTRETVDIMDENFWKL